MFNSSGHWGNPPKKENVGKWRQPKIAPMDKISETPQNVERKFVCTNIVCKRPEMD
jgi:hypothetical protein